MRFMGGFGNGGSPGLRARPVAWQSRLGQPVYSFKPMDSTPPPASPTRHLAYRQEYLKAKAEDMGQVLSTGETVTVPYGSFTSCVKTKDWSAIERGSVEHKYYSKEVGNVVLETEGGDKTRVELIEVTRAAEGKLKRKN